MHVGFFYFLKLLYLFGRERNVPPTGSHPSWPQCPVLDQAKSSSQDLQLSLHDWWQGQKHVETSTAFPRSLFGSWIASREAKTQTRARQDASISLPAMPQHHQFMGFTMCAILSNIVQFDTFLLHSSWAINHHLCSTSTLFNLPTQKLSGSHLGYQKNWNTKIFVL